MSGPAPKPKEQRRRRNAPTYEWVLLEGTFEGPIPELKGKFDKATKEWWATIWRSPMATQWQEGDVPALTELAMLRQEFLKGNVALSNTVQTRSDKFGLTPKGRRDLRWIITEEDAKRANQPIAPVRKLRAVQEA